MPCSWLPSPHPLQETTGRLQAQLWEAQQELAQAAQRHRADLAALKEEGHALLQNKQELLEQVLLSPSPPADPLSSDHSVLATGNKLLGPRV